MIEYMPEQYHLDLEQFSLKKLKQILENGDILPGRKILLENIDERFTILETSGITNLKELINALSSMKKLDNFTRQSGLPHDYLIILRRQARSYISNPVYLREIPGVNPDYIEQLNAAGIKHTKQLFERALSPGARRELAQQAGVPYEAILELVKLSDLARAGWTGPIFVRLFYETGTDTLEKLSYSSPDEMFQKLRTVNYEQKLTSATFTVKDVAACIETAKVLPKVIEYE
jgi:hypothetical protein